MATLMLKFDAPLQSWGTALKLADHETDNYPSKSGVIGMIASAMGISRDQDAAIRHISDSVRFGVRIDKPGELVDDYQVSEYKKTEKKSAKKISHRYYLSDASFTCGIEAGRDELEEIRTALKNPANALYLGRRGCPPTVKLVGEIFDKSLEEALKAENDIDNRRIIVDSDDVSDKAVRDDPISFSFGKRMYEYRFIKEI